MQLRDCSLAARGLWIECLGLMHEATPRGYLVLGAEPVTVERLALLVGRPLKEVRTALGELQRAAVPSRDEHGTVYSRRMVRDTEKSEAAAASGARGGNPALKGVDKGLDIRLLIPAGAQTRDLGSGISGGEATDDKPEDLTAARFETFWDAYPLKQNKKAAERAFGKIKPDHELLAVLLDAIRRQKLGRQWQQGVVPHASTWLNNERWKDDLGLEPVPAAVQRALGPSAARAVWRDECPHNPTCQTPTLCQIATMKAEQTVGATA